MSKKQKKRSSLLLPILLAPLLILGGTWYWLKIQIEQPVRHNLSGRVVTIIPGTTQRQIVRQLARDGVIHSAWTVQIWLRTFGRDFKLKAGDYRFPSPISPRSVLELLDRGQSTTQNITIPEGFNRYDIARLLADLPELKQPAPDSSQSLLPLFDRKELIDDLDPEATNLEGYLFPDTYEYTASTTREQIVEMMVARFRQVYNADLERRSGELGLVLRKSVTLASLIEKEARVDRERELISAVFHRRLREGIPLACDPTVIYAALLANNYRGKIFRSDLDRQSPYNTYRNQGLPPGPIASPGRRSLEAAVNPASVDYLFFVVDVTKNDGSHVFTTRAADHEAAVRRLRQAEQAARN